MFNWYFIFMKVTTLNTLYSSCYPHGIARMIFNVYRQKPPRRWRRCTASRSEYSVVPLHRGRFESKFLVRNSSRYTTEMILWSMILKFTTVPKLVMVDCCSNFDGVKLHREPCSIALHFQFDSLKTIIKQHP